jgi:DNA-binding MarR family transcriptional regulator
MATGHDLAMRLRIAYLTLHRRTGSALARFGLTGDQFVLLTALADGVAVTQKELVRRTGSDPNTVSEMLARLERRGLVFRERHAFDGWARSVALTEEGRRVQRRLWQASDPLRVVLEDLFPAGVLGVLVGHLDRIANAMTPADEPEERDGPQGPPRGRIPPRRRRRPAAEIEGG